MTPAQIQHIRTTSKVAAIVTTRNAIFWVVDQQGRASSEPGSDARYELLEWNDANELLTLRTQNQIRNDQFVPIMHINYGIIDEIISLEQ